MPFACWLYLALFLAAEPAPQAGQYFQIEVVDAETGRGVPLVELTTVNHIRYVTDSNGIVAFYEPGLMNQTVFFDVKSHGYEFPQDGFGFRGRALDVRQGGSAKLEIKRINIARRLYRVTGAGIYRDSLLTGRAAPIVEPILNGQVFGSDSVVTAVYRNKLYWFWGDTLRPAYPLGNFHSSGATSQLPDAGGLDPARGVNLTYFKDHDGFARPMVPMPGEGPTWIMALVALADGGRERMFACYVRIRGKLEIHARGLAEWDDKQEQFQQVAELDPQTPVFPSGHPFTHAVEGSEYIYFADPLPLVRVKADADALRDPSQYEAYTCLVSGSRLGKDPVATAQLDRDDRGRLLWAWKRDTPVVDARLQQRLIRSGPMKQEESLIELADPDTGGHVTPHRGSVCWNAYRRRWVMIFVEAGGTSPLGEIWFAEAATPTGPWTTARKIVTHDRYSFYNPKQHPQFDQQGGRVIYFEGTYTREFSGNPEATPRYDYNQIMYQLDLADERLRLSEVDTPR